MPSDYDAFATNWDQTRQRPWPEFDYFLPKLKPGDRLLDIGCGNGRLRQFLSPSIIKPGDYFGLDLSDKLLNIARKKNKRDHFFRHDFSQKWPFGADQFDWGIALASFHHLLTKKDQVRFWEETYRVLKPGGKVFITTWVLPKKYFWPNILEGRWKNWCIPFGTEKHPRWYRKVGHKELKRQLKKAGFQVLSHQKFENRNHIALAQKPL
jgi:SAM-dependent methyltransferase